jgi:hypothetical protein
MHFSLDDSRTIGFKKWSDPQRPIALSDPPDIPEPEKQIGEFAPPGAVTGAGRE